jgi:anti-sigma B factor antagonist
VTGVLIPPVVTVSISGEIDIATCQAMRNALGAGIGRGPVHLEVDMSAVTFMDASGIGALLAARRQAVDAGGSLTLRAPSSAVRRLTGILELDEVLVTR